MTEKQKGKTYRSGSCTVLCTKDSVPVRNHFEGVVVKQTDPFDEQQTLGTHSPFWTKSEFQENPIPVTIDNEEWVQEIPVGYAKG